MSCIIGHFGFDFLAKVFYNMFEEVANPQKAKENYMTGKHQSNRLRCESGPSLKGSLPSPFMVLRGLLSHLGRFAFPPPERNLMPHRIIELTQGYTTLVDAADYDWVSKHRWRYHNGGRAVRWQNMNGKTQTLFLHRAVLEHHGVCLDGLQTDHRNRCPLDNRRSNLRVATHSENMQNRSMHKNNSSGFTGVWWSREKKKWVAELRANGRKHYLGAFTDIDKAARAYDQAALELHGEFATLNLTEEQS